MAGKTAILSVRIIGDAVEAVGALGEVDKATGRTEVSMDKIAVGAGVAFAAVTALAVHTGNAASEMEQAIGGVDAVFKDQAATVHAWADSAAVDVGLARDEYSNFSTLVGAQLKNMGIPMGEVTDRSRDLIKMGADLAAQYGGSTSDAVSALSSLLRGERDPIERYGVSINQAALDAEKAAMGLAGLTGEADKNASLQATLALLTRQTADANGAFGREVDTTAHKQQVANAEWQNAQIALGEAFLPALSLGAELVGNFSSFLSENSAVMSGLIIVVGLLAGGVLIANGAIKAYESIVAIVTAAQWLWNAAMTANPIGLIVIGIAAVVAIVVLWITHWDELSQKVADFFNSLFGWVGDAVGQLGQLFGGMETQADVTARVTADTSALDRIAPMSARVMAAPAESFGAMTLSKATSAVVASSSSGSLSTRDREAQTVVNNTYNISGALDPNSVAKQIRSINANYERSVGRASSERFA